jgi:hypothetical protein
MLGDIGEGRVVGAGPQVLPKQPMGTVKDARLVTTLRPA